MSADTVSSLYPDRPIRPLPKRRLRERLAPEVAGSIKYPPAPQNTTPLFYYPYGSRDDDSSEPPPAASSSRDRLPALAPGLGRRAGAALVAGEGDHAASRRNNVLSRGPHTPQRLPPSKLDQGRSSGSQPPLSAASSADGYYDPFEVTNNKKKRKIPTAGDTAPNGNHVVSDDVSTVESPTLPSANGRGDASTPASSPYSNGFASAGQNISGPGRGRYGRVRNGRSPLRALSDSTNNWATRNGKLRPAQWVSQTSQNTGIISNAIANAEKLTPSQGQENISLLHQQSARPSPASTQFTFTCDSQVPTSLTWPGSDRGTSMSTHQIPVPKEGPQKPSPAAQTETAQTEAASLTPAPAAAVADLHAPAHPAKPSKSGQEQQPRPSKGSRRRSPPSLKFAAKARRRQTEYQNRLNPPKPGDLWICEFCEYETIFGHPPKALVRSYEIKDRKLKQQEAERRRQLEKVKTRSRKGKRGNKSSSAKNNNGNNNGASQDRHLPHGGSQSTHHHSHSHSNNSPETRSEFDYDDDLEEEDELGDHQPPPLEPAAGAHGPPPPGGFAWKPGGHPPGGHHHTCCH